MKPSPLELNLPVQLLFRNVWFRVYKLLWSLFQMHSMLYMFLLFYLFFSCILILK